MNWETLPHDAREQALDVAWDAIARQARALRACDPDVAEALNVLAVELEQRFLVKRRAG